MLKIMLAYDEKKHVTSAKQALSARDRSYYCMSCGCPLILRYSNFYERPWFEHDNGQFPLMRLRQCGYRDPDEMRQEKDQELRQTAGGVPAIITIRQWQCVLCGNIYPGNKHCGVCGSGIYSREIDNLR